MRMISISLLMAMVAATVLAQSKPPAHSWGDENKLIVVTTADWNAVQGTLTRYQRKHGIWEKVGKPVAIVVGKTGLAWDPQLAKQNAEQFPGPIKHEADGKSPAGIFHVPSTFGFAPSLGITSNYVSLTPTTECVDDTSSRYYTKIVDRLKIGDVDWNSSEKMRQVPGYRQGAVVDYNTSNPVPGDGSCIFLHIWSGPESGTAGCTAMAAENMEQLFSWLKTKGATALVQLPAAEYQRLRSPWQLP